MVICKEPFAGKEDCRLRNNVTYFPPFPVLEVTLSTPAEGLTTDTLPALVDTDSDATFVPLEHLSQIGAVETTEMWVRSHSAVTQPEGQR
jgi:hypothetical protein